MTAERRVQIIGLIVILAFCTAAAAILVIQFRLALP